VRRIPLVILLLTLVASGFYVFLYLNRWEWTRALFVTMVFVTAEVALVGWLVIERIRRLEHRLEDQRSADTVDPSVLMRLRQHRPEHDRFAWLSESMTRTNVFITMVVGGGILLSGLAWVIDRIAGRTVSSGRERQLALELAPLAFPTGHLVAHEAALIAQELPSSDDPELRLLVGDTRGQRP
jgi:hypothetical protein